MYVRGGDWFVMMAVTLDVVAVAAIIARLRRRAEGRWVRPSSTAVALAIGLGVGALHVVGAAAAFLHVASMSDDDAGDPFQRGSPTCAAISLAMNALTVVALALLPAAIVLSWKAYPR
jgi:ABC-type amino acid transport system permease subunit